MKCFMMEGENILPFRPHALHQTTPSPVPGGGEREVKKEIGGAGPHDGGSWPAALLRSGKMTQTFEEPLGTDGGEHRLTLLLTKT